MQRANRKSALIGAFALILAGFGVGILFTSQFDLELTWRGAPKALEAQADAELQEAILKASQTFTEVARTVSPSVVTISSAKVFRPSDSRDRNRRFDEPVDPFDFFHRFFDEPDGDYERRMQGLGSGVIVRSDGYILTNNHVIAHADEIQVSLQDGSHLDAELVGTDPKTDIAVIKVKAEDMPAVTMGDSDRLQVGEWVLAIGSPFSENLSHTVTAGIVSAIGRSYVGLTDYEDYIQTDAAINPGNSGGALVDVEGKIIGINTAIATRSGGSQGIGFAIPINMARHVMDALIEDGKVTRGWLGVQIQNLNDELAEAKGLKVTDGVLIADVLDSGPARDAGIRRGDVITHYEGEETQNTAQLRNRVAATRPGTSVEVRILRDGRPKMITLKLGELPDDPTAPIAQSNRSVEKLGFQVRANSPEIQARFELDRDDGVVITEVRRASPAARQGIREGDIILELNNKPVSNLSGYEKTMEDAEAGDTLLFLLERGGTTHFAAIKVPENEE